MNINNWLPKPTKQGISNTSLIWSPLGVNILGSFLIGFLAFYFSSITIVEYRGLVITGFLGALTTFSTFSYETIGLLEHGNYVKAILNIFFNVSLSLVATLIGIWVFKRIFGN